MTSFTGRGDLRRRHLAATAAALLVVLGIAGTSGAPAPLYAEQDEAQGKTQDEAQPKGMLSLKDGRIFVDLVLEKTKEGFIDVVLQAGRIHVPEDLVLDYFMPGASLGFEPKTEEEKEKVEKGYVRYQGKWVREAVAQRMLEKEQEEREMQLRELKLAKKLRNMKTHDTRDFKFKHNLPEHLAEELIALFEEFHDEWKKRWRKRLDLKAKPTISFYADEQDYLQYTGIFAGALGFYHFGGITLHMYWDRSDPDLTRNVLYHEATHMLVDGIDGDFKYPPWIEEGMAEYYGGSKWDPDARPGQRMQPGGILPGRLVVVKKMMKDKKPMTLEDLISYDRVGGKNFGATEYAWAWTFIRFMHDNKKYEKGFQKYWLDLAHKRGGIDRVPFGGEWTTIKAEDAKELLLKYLRVKDLAELEKEWYEYIGTLEVESLAGLEAAGRRFKAFGEHKEAKEVLKEAISKGAKNPLTYLAWAEYLYRDSDLGEADRMLAKALELDPMLAEAYHRRSIVKRAMVGEENDAEGLRLLRIAAELDPFGYAWELAEAEAEEARKKAEKGD